MLTGKNILILGAREGGYGASIAVAAIAAGARVFGTSLDPLNSKEKAFFDKLGIELLDVPLRFDSDKRAEVAESLRLIEQSLRSRGVDCLTAVIHAVARGARPPPLMSFCHIVISLKTATNFPSAGISVRPN